jgi:acyl carrier protein
MSSCGRYCAAPDLARKTSKDGIHFKQIEFIIVTEQRFGIRMNTREIDGLQNVGNLVRMVASKNGR